MTECYRCWAEVDLNCLSENLAQIRRLAGPGKKILSVVKADAYGHGLRQIAAALMHSGTDIFGVANLAEARAIRSVGKGWPILMLGACLPFEVDAAVRDDIMPTLSSFEEAEQFSASAIRQGKTAEVQLKLDSGMGRLGASPDGFPALFEAIERLPGIAILGVFTHYSSSEDDIEFTASQREAFGETARALLKAGKRIEWLHAINSGGLLFERDDLSNTVRPGLLIYGIVPPAQRQLEPRVRAQFRPALNWKCRVSFVKNVPAGTPISYGHTFVTSEPMRLATITAGYGDGYFRAASNRSEVLIGGQRCAVLGRVTMDQMVVDASRVPQCTPGDEVALIGTQGDQEITATQLAAWCGTVPWEVLTNITYRVPRVYRGSQAA